MYDPRKLRLTGEQVLVQLDEDTETTAGGLIKPDGSYEHVLRTGEVISVGPGKRLADGGRSAMSLSAGEGVVFIRFMANTKTSESFQAYVGTDYVLLKEDDVLLAYDRSENIEFGQ